MKAEYGISKEIAAGEWRKCNLTLDGVEGETPGQLMDRAKQEVEDWFFKQILPPAANAEPWHTPSRLPDIETEKPIPEDQRIQALIKDIMAEKELRRPDGTGGLLAWQLLVKKNPSLQSAYDQRLKELTK